MHAGFFFAQKYPEITNRWLTDSQYLIIVRVNSESDLKTIQKKADYIGLNSVMWSEPDLDNQATALALEPHALSRVLCANLPLAGKMN